MAEHTGLSGAPADAQSILSPDAAIAELMEGNRRFAGGKMLAYQHDLDVLRQNTLQKQEPFAGILSCADSRVPLEIIFDQTIGQLFVTRIAGNIVTPEVIATLEFGAEVLGTRAILVLGHSNCGAVNATIQGKPVPGQIGALFPHIQPAVEQAGHDLGAATRANAKMQSVLLKESSPLLAALVSTGKLKIAAGFYDLANGHVTLL